MAANAPNEISGPSTRSHVSSVINVDSNPRPQHQTPPIDWGELAASVDRGRRTKEELKKASDQTCKKLLDNINRLRIMSTQTMLESLARSQGQHSSASASSQDSSGTQGTQNREHYPPRVRWGNQELGWFLLKQREQYPRRAETPDSDLGDNYYGAGVNGYRR